MAAERTARCRWDGDLVHGAGIVAGDSGALAELAVTWASRTGASDGHTSPEELIAAAHASCFSMALAHGLEQDGHPPDWLETSATVLLEDRDGAPTLTSSELEVTGVVGGIDAEAFIRAATDAGRNCPVSRALGSLEISIRATLQEPPPEPVEPTNRDGVLAEAIQAPAAGTDRTSEEPTVGAPADPASPA